MLIINLSIVCFDARSMYLQH